MAFLVFEGADGVGKTTLMKSLVRELKKRGITCRLTREPGGTRSGRQIRRILLRKTDTPPVPITEILLYYADRSQNMAENIKPALKKGHWLISDRYWASTTAYQYGGRGFGKKLIDSLRDQVCGSVEPDLWILLDVPLRESQIRLNRLQNKDRFEQEALAFHKKVRACYLKLAKADPRRWLVLSGTKSRKELVKEILKRLEQKKLLPPVS